MGVNYSKKYFSNGLIWTFVIGSIVGSVYLIVYTDFAWAISILAIALLVLFTTKYTFIVDVDKKEITDAFSILGWNIRNEMVNYRELECLKVEEKQHSYTANTRSRVRQVNYTEYIATIQYDEDKSIEVTRGTDFDLFSEEVNQMANELKLSIEK